MRKLCLLAALGITGILLFFLSCNKIETELRNSLKKGSSATLMKMQSSGPPYMNDADSVEVPTILGQHLTNPYTIANMEQAYHNVCGGNYVPEVTNWYVRFKPANVDELQTLLDLGIELFDTPLDYEILQQGDYYQDPSVPDEEITWLYAVVSPDFMSPDGITCQILAHIHIPPEGYSGVETEAERLAAIQDSAMQSTFAVSGVVQPNYPSCLPGMMWDPVLGKCVPIPTCGPGYYYDPVKRKCVPKLVIIPPPPPPAVDASTPAGHLFVHDTQLGDQPLRNVRIVAKRWFKIERVYTDNNGYFECSKKFKHKVKINVKFKNDYANVRGVRGFRLWEILFPVAKTIGIFSGDKNNISYTFNQIGPLSSKGNRYWAAATVHNAVQEYRDLAADQGIGLPSSNLKILISNWGLLSGGATPMYAKRLIAQLPEVLLKTYAASRGSLINGGISALTVILKRQVDIYYSYNIGDINLLTSDRIGETMFHELTHAAHYAKVGNSWWNDLVNGEINEMISHFGSAFSPYGDGSNSSTAPIIALTESWAYYMGHFLADQQYGFSSSSSIEQGILYFNNSPVFGLSSHLNLLEDFSPGRTNDPFHWIPQGLFYDMVDARNETSPVIDQVLGYTNSEFYGALDNDIRDLSQFRQRLLQENGNNQSVEINSLFNQYGY